MLTTLICCTTAAFAAPAPAPTPAPPTPAATSPASATATTTAAAAAPLAELDRSTPKAAAVSLFNAITAGDRDAVADSFFAAGDDQRELATAMADVIVAGKKLGDAAKAEFGGAAADPIGRGMLDPADLEKLEDATVLNTAADAAVMTVPGQPRPMSFRKQGAQWKLVVTDFGGAAADNVAKQTRLIRAMANAIDAAAADIAAGKHKTTEEATFAIQQSLHQVMLRFYRPTTTTTRAAATTATATAPTTSTTGASSVER